MGIEFGSFEFDCAGQLGGCAAKRKLSQVIGVLISSTTTRGRRTTTVTRTGTTKGCTAGSGPGGWSGENCRTRSKSGSQSFAKEADKKSICFYFSGGRLSGVSGRQASSSLHRLPTPLPPALQSAIKVTPEGPK